MSEFIGYEVEDAVAVITLNRPDRCNAQNQQFLEELNAAWERAAEDDAVRVILLRAEGPHFSAGHDMSPEEFEKGAFRRIEGTIPDRGLRNRLYRISMPVSVIWGAQDRVAPPAYGEAFAAAIPHARLTIVPEAGHMPHWERPELVKEAAAFG